MTDGAKTLAQLPDPLPVGYQLSHYTIETELPPLRMGRAYLAYDNQLRATVAINVLSPLLRSEMGIARFRWGSRRAVLERNETVINYSEWHGVPFVVVPYAEGVGATVDVGVTFPTLEE